MDPAALKIYLAQRAALIDRALVEAMPPPSTFPERLHQAMLYSLTAPGKRIRPILCLAAAAAAGGREEDALAPACAVEMIHAHSLIHDDLPCMDDDDLRRGLPTCHVRFGEATALLAGDALISSAYAVLARAPLADGTVRRLVATLAAAAGSEGICGGQEADIAAEGTAADLKTVETIHRYKTGSLLRAAVAMGGIAGGATPPRLGALSDYGSLFGLAFQIRDDLLDVTGNREQLGKTPGKDASKSKPTYASLLGTEGCRNELDRLADECVRVLEKFGPEADPLRALARFLAAREP